MDIPGITKDDEFTELTDFHPNRVDLVGKAANGTSFLIAKQDTSAGLLDAGYVRSLISKEAPVPETGETVLPNGIVIKGSPAAMAAFIHAANARKAEPGDVAKADMSTKSIKAEAAADVEKSWAAYNAAHPHHGGSHKKKLPPKPTPSAFARAQQTLADEAAGKTVSAADLKNAHQVHEAHLAHLAHEKAEQETAAAAARPAAAPPAAPKPAQGAAERPLIAGQVNKNSREAGVPDAVTKADPMDAAGDAVALDEGTDGMDPTVPLGAPGEMAPGDPTDPGSPAWESIDAATAQKWLSIAARLKNALGVLAERELLEAASADPSDAENAWDLQDAMCAVDFAIERLAVFAAGEQAEAELGCEMDAMCKALAGFDAAPLGVIEGLTEVRKAGRVLSSANEAKLRSAAQAIGEVLSSLPQAPEGVAKSKEAPVPQVKDQAAQVAKETPSPEAQAAGTGPVNAGGTTGLGEPRATGPAAALPADGPQQARPGDVPGRQVVKSALKVAVYDQHRVPHLIDPARLGTVIKADDGDGKVTMQAVFDENGNLVGIVDPADITPVAGAGGDSGDDGDDDAGDDAAPAPAADDMTPQPPADAGTPADAVGKAAEENVITLTQDVAKAIAEQAARTAIEASEAAHAQVVAKMAADNAGLAGQLEAVTKRLETVENTPAMPKVFTSGQVPPAHTLRGQDQGAGTVIDVAKAREMKQRMYTADPAEANRIKDDLNRSAVASLEAIHAGGRH